MPVSEEEVYALRGVRTKPRPTGMIRPSVIVRCSAIECGSVSHPAAWSPGTTYWRHVSASVPLNVPPATSLRMPPLGALKHTVELAQTNHCNVVNAEWAPPALLAKMDLRCCVSLTAAEEGYVPWD